METRQIQINLDDPLNNVDPYYLRITDNPFIDPILPSNEAGSLKALHMELGGAQHLFGVLEGLGYPGKMPGRFYHLTGSRIRENNAWMLNRLVNTKLKIVAVTFPGNLGSKAARSEYRVERGILDTFDFINMPIGRTDAFIYAGRIVEVAVGHQLNNRKVIYRINFQSMLRTITTTKQYSQIPINFPCI